MDSELKEITETKEIILNDTVAIHNELKKLSPLERVEILNKIIKEEEAEEKAELIRNQKQEKNSRCEDNNTTSKNGCKMYLNLKSVLNELQCLRIQMSELQNEVKYLHRNNQTSQCQLLNQQHQQIYRVDDYTNDDSCNIISFVIDWMPMWIFCAFVLFTITSKPRTSLSSIAGTCPISGLGEFITKL